MDAPQSCSWNDYITGKFIHTIQKVAQADQINCEELKSKFNDLNVIAPEKFKILLGIIESNPKLSRATKLKIHQIALDFFHYKSQIDIMRAEQCKKNYVVLSPKKKGPVQNYWDGALWEYMRFQLTLSGGEPLNNMQVYQFLAATIHEEPKTITSWTKDWIQLVDQYAKRCKKESPITDMCQRFTKLFTKEHFLINFMPVLTQHSFVGFQKYPAPVIKELLLRYVEDPGNHVPLYLFIAEFPEYDGGDDLYIFRVEFPSIQLDASGEKTYFFQHVQIDRPTAFIEVFTIDGTDKKAIFDKNNKPSKKIIANYGVGIMPIVLFEMECFLKRPHHSVVCMEKYLNLDSISNSSPKIDSIKQTSKELPKKAENQNPANKLQKGNIFQELARRGEVPKPAPEAPKPVVPQAETKKKTQNNQTPQTIQTDNSKQNTQPRKENPPKTPLNGPSSEAGQPTQTKRTKQKKTTQPAKEQPPIVTTPPERAPTILYDIPVPEGFKKPDDLTASDLLQLRRQNDSKKIKEQTKDKEEKKLEEKINLVSTQVNDLTKKPSPPFTILKRTPAPLTDKTITPEPIEKPTYEATIFEGDLSDSLKNPVILNQDSDSSTGINKIVDSQLVSM